MDVTAVITNKNPFVVNEKPVTVSLALGEGVSCKTNLFMAIDSEN